MICKSEGNVEYWPVDRALVERALLKRLVEMGWLAVREEREETVYITRKGREGLAKFGIDNSVLCGGKKTFPRGLLKVILTAPSIVAVGEPFDLKVEIRGPLGDPFNAYYSAYSHFSFSATDSGATLPEKYEYEFKPEDRGARRFSGIRLGTSGVHIITATKSDGPLSGTSNPILCEKGIPPCRLYWGDIHFHIRESRSSANRLKEGPGTVDEAYAYARDVSALDFCALTDHGSNLSDSEWEDTQRGAAKYYEPGRFVTFTAYEWDWNLGEPINYGHRCVYCLTDDLPLYRGKNPESDTAPKLWDLLKKSGKKVIVIPHHVARAGASLNWEFFNPELERLVEIYSIWRSSERSWEKGNPYPLVTEWGEVIGRHVQDGLAMGYKFGFTGGSEAHDGRAGNTTILNGEPINPELRRIKFYPWGGLTAAYAKELTREGIWDALYNRRTYATTGARIILDFRVNGHIMGEELFVESSSAPREIFAKVIGTSLILKVDVVKNNIDVYTYMGSGIVESFRYCDREPLNGITYYYLRVTQSDGEMAWSSPIWLQVKE